MKDKRTNRKIIIITVLLFAILASFGVIVSMTDRAQTETVTTSTREQKPTVSTEKTETDDPIEYKTLQQPDATVFIASDYQMQKDWPTPKESLTGILEAVKTAGKAPNEIILCGDYTNDRNLHNYQLSPERSIEEIQETSQSVFPELTKEMMLFLQGNHDHLTGSISASGLHEFDDYLVYMLNTQYDFPWSQGVTSGCLDKVKKSSKEMKNCFNDLIEVGETRPVIIAGHVPLHFTARTSTHHSTGDNLYASLIFDVVNEAAESLDIVYFFGHNHSKGWDCYMGGSSVYKAKGEILLVPAFEANDIKTDRYTEERLNFTYLNAGYTGYYMNCGPNEIDNGTMDQYHAADEMLTGTVCEIWPDHLELTRYDADGVHPLGAEGTADPYKGGIDRGLIDEKYYSHRTDSPQQISRKH